jgi:hypothetical protein
MLDPTTNVEGQAWTECDRKGVAAMARGFLAGGFAAILAFVAVVPFARLYSDHAPVPWYGRVWMVCVSLALAGILAGAFRSLGHPAARRYFGLVAPRGPYG